MYILSSVVISRALALFTLGLTILETTTSLLGFIPSRRTSSVQLVIEKRLLLPSSVFTYVPFPWILYRYPSVTSSSMAFRTVILLT